MKQRRLSTGFTLIELSASMAVLVVLVLACGSIVALACRETTTSAGWTASQIQTADAAAQLTDDLNVALNFTQRSANSATFTVPDRLNLGAPQAVTWSWAGTSGSPLTRQFNGGPAVTLLPNVQNFQLAYLPRPMGTAAATPIQVFSHSTSTSLKDYGIDNNHWAAEFFTPSLPSGTSSYTITKLRIQLKAAGQAGIMTVQVTAPSLLMSPTSNVLATTTVYESSFSNNYEYVDIPFTGLSGLRPLQTLCFVFSYSSGGATVAQVETDTALLVAAAGANWSTSSNGGSAWTLASSATSPMFYVFGTVP